VQERARAIVSAVNPDQWRATLLTPDLTPITELALSLAGTEQAPPNLPSLSDALHDHFKALAEGDAAWRPDSDVFAQLASLLSASTRKTLGSQFCAALEPRDGQVDPGLLETYGPFLAGEKDFRIHQKLPNFLARAVELDEWQSVEWIVGVAEAHKDTLQKKGRESEIEHLSGVVSEKLSQLGEDGPEPLVKLAQLLGLSKTDDH
jgi:hypothetical protein